MPWLLSGLLLAPLCHADPVPEGKMKVAFLYNFGLQTEWPASTGSTLRLCVLSQDPFAESMNDIDGQEVNGRKLQIVRLSSTTEVKACQILYLGEAETPRVKSILNTLNDAPVLTVSDDANLAKSGIMISMFMTNRRLVFNVNTNPVKRSGLTLSSRLLRLAKNVD